mmetsp:Transcript_3585/g.11214  ORF Transcript_3585/g.11214 Transcript_3585/m.11214 type:complete len:225 (+) Transcript_3585:126-800(+)
MDTSPFGRRILRLLYVWRIRAGTRPRSSRLFTRSWAMCVAAAGFMCRSACGSSDDGSTSGTSVVVWLRPYLTSCWPSLRRTILRICLSSLLRVCLSTSSCSSSMRSTSSATCARLGCRECTLLRRFSRRSSMAFFFTLPAFFFSSFFFAASRFTWLFDFSAGTALVVPALTSSSHSLSVLRSPLYAGAARSARSALNFSCAALRASSFRTATATACWWSSSLGW